MSKPPSTANELPYPATRFERFVLGRKRWLILICFLAAFGVAFFAQVFENSKRNHFYQSSSGLQPAHAIGLAMYAYASDHDGKYPQGNSSTEVFQQLIHGGYVTDPSMFYTNMDGKVAAHGNTKTLKPENIGWDVTDAVTLNDPDDLSLLFSSGYKIDYAAGGQAHPFKNAVFPDGIAVYYKGNAVKFVNLVSGNIPVVPATFDPKGKTYHQLTPGGPLP